MWRLDLESTNVENFAELRDDGTAAGCTQGGC
jgi:hypothetical protein